MVIESVLKVGGKALTQVAKKTYVKPMCKVRTLESLGLKMEQLMGDTVQISKKAKSTVENIVNSSDKKLFYFAQKHPFNSPGGNISEDGLVLTHLTDYLPRNGCIDTAYSAIGGNRDSVHFAINHGVTNHLFGNWADKSYAIICPMKSTRKIAGNKFFGGVPSDFYSRGKIRLPQDAVIVRYNEKIPAGKYRISDASKIKEMCNLKGIKLIETSEKNMKTSVDNIIQKLGYKLKDTSEPWYWGLKVSKTKFKSLKQFNEFIQAHGMTPAFHTYTPNAKTENLIGSIIERAYIEHQWCIVRDGQVLFDAKKEALDILDYIEKYAKNAGYQLDYDITKLRKIIATSETPKEAVASIKNDMGITTSVMLEKDKLDFFNVINFVPEGKEGLLQSEIYITKPIWGKEVEITEDALLNYLANPNHKTYAKIFNESKKLTSMYELSAVNSKYAPKEDLL